MVDKEKNIELLTRKIEKCTRLLEQLKRCSSWEDKLSLLSLPKQPWQNELPVEKAYVLSALHALDPAVLDPWKGDYEALKPLVDVLWRTEEFYQDLGGLVGYYLTTLEHVVEHTKSSEEHIFPPPSIDLRSGAYAELVNKGLDALPEMGEIYTLGGAGDRLHLVDEKSGEPLPVALLKFCGRTLLEGLIRDLEAREYLYFRRHGKKLSTPIILMLSQDKNNDEIITAFCEKMHWFGRPKERFFILVQPVCPVITIEGTFAVKGPLDLELKPGGHGVLWKLAIECGAFDWLEQQNRSFCLVRQVNNPLAGIDNTLLSLAGYGYSHKKAFGFTSCPRMKGMAEGMNVLRGIPTKEGLSCSISNIEYTEFAKHPHRETDGEFFANTNILYADIQAVREAVSALPIPGLLVNLKHSPLVRLESTMQNIADAITDTISEPITTEKLRTFLLLNDRSKTMSVTKKAYAGASLYETPEGCFYDLLKENCRLLKEVCGCTLHEMPTQEEYLQKGPKKGPSLLFLYHPALGPLYSIIAQKISKGSFSYGAELQIEASEVALHGLSLDGSLLIKGDGASNCLLEQVTIQNKGLDHTVPQVYWKNELTRKEALHIILEGNAQFIAKNVHFVGNREIRVPDGFSCIAQQKSDGSVLIHYEKR